MIRRLSALAVGAVLIAAMAVLGITADTAHATTPTCTAGQVPVGADPISCGGLFFPQLGAFGTPPSGTPLTLTLQTPQWNGHITDEPYSQGNKAQDETVWEVCNGFNPAGRTEANPCGTGFTPTLNPDTNLPLFVPEFTPLGKHLGGAINTPGNLCLSVEGVHNGPRHALRWRLVARTCDTYGAVFFAGLPDGGPGITGVVVHPNPFQTWTAVGPVNGAGNFVFANDALSGHFLNRLFVVDVPGATLAPGQWLLAFPENDNANQVGEIAGCNGAAVVITPGDTDCP